MSDGPESGVDRRYRALRREARRSSGLPRQWAIAVSARRLSRGAPDLLVALELADTLRRHDVGVEILGPARWYAPAPGTEVVVALTPAFEPFRSPVPAFAFVEESQDAWSGRADRSAYVGSLVSDLDRGVVAPTERADLLVEAVDAALRDPAPLTIGVIGLLPDYRASNPYQAMLLADLPELLPMAVSRPTDLLAARARGARTVLHVHWTTPVLAGAVDPTEATGRAEEFLARIDEVRRQGVLVVWTVHNVLPHDCAFPAVESLLAQGLADRADLVHVMSRETLAAVAPYYEIADDHRLRVIPHASYLGIYPDEVDAAEARRRLGFATEDTVVLFLGQIRPYKGLEELLAAWEEPGRDPTARLHVVGSVGVFDGADALVERVRRVADRVHLGTVPDEELPTVLGGCDVVVLPHRAPLNSGTLLLAHTYARPVIAPRRGCLPSHAAPGAVRWFGPQDGTLADALRDLGPLRDPAVRAAARESAAGYPPGAMAADFAEVLRSGWPD